MVVSVTSSANPSVCPSLAAMTVLFISLHCPSVVFVPPRRVRNTALWSDQVSSCTVIVKEAIKSTY